MRFLLFVPLLLLAACAQQTPMMAKVMSVQKDKMVLQTQDELMVLDMDTGHDFRELAKRGQVVTLVPAHNNGEEIAAVILPNGTHIRMN